MIRTLDFLMVHDPHGILTGGAIFMLMFFGGGWLMDKACDAIIKWRKS